jgi:hypothetical protein
VSRAAAVVVAAVAACAPPGATTAPPHDRARATTDPTTEPTAARAMKPAPAGDPDSAFGPLDVGKDYLTYRRVTTEPFLSAVHGNRWVHVWVNEIGAEAYLRGAPIPVGTIIVKESFEGEGGKPSNVRGPLYVMEKRAPGYAPGDDLDWYNAIHWATPTPAMRAALGGPIYWRDRSPRVRYCYDCHDSYDRGLGGLVPSSLLQR